MNSIKLKTNGYLIRPLKSSDASDRYLSWLLDEKISRTLDSDGKNQTLKSIVKYIQSHNNKTDFLFGIFIKNPKNIEGEHIGNISFRFQPRHKLANIGIMIGDCNYWGKGAPLETREKVIDWAFDNLNCNKIEAGCYSINMPAIYNFKRQHWEMEGIQKDHRIVENKNVDLILFGMRKEVWYANRNT
jgi:[ribosomal protein S5]-alanine N-acetyltransferase